MPFLPPGDVGVTVQSGTLCTVEVNTEDRGVRVTRPCAKSTWMRRDTATVRFHPSNPTAITTHISEPAEELAMRTWDMETGSLLSTCPLPCVAWDFAVSRDGDMAAIACSDTNVKLVNLRRPTSIAANLVMHTADAVSVDFSHARPTMLVSGGLDGSVCLWNTTTQNCVEKVRIHEAAVCDVAFARDRHEFASAGMDGLVHHWQLTSSGARAVDFRRSRWARCYSVAYGTDGGRLFAVGYDDGIVNVWDRRLSPLVKSCFALFLRQECGAPRELQFHPTLPYKLLVDGSDGGACVDLRTPYQVQLGTPTTTSAPAGVM